MRGPRKNLAVSARLQRRAIFMTLLCAASPVLGGEPSSHSLSMPPLPLQAASGPSTSATGNAVRSNPFCDAVVPARGGSIQLASGGDTPSVRLLPIGTAIGLQAIGENDSVRVELPVMTIEKPAEAAVQTNPLIQSTHHGDRQLIDADVETPARKSSIVLMPIKKFEPHVVEQPKPIVAKQPQPIVEQQPIIAKQPQPLVEQQSEPICFSFSDSSADVPVVADESSEDVEENYDEEPLLAIAPIVVGEDEDLTDSEEANSLVEIDFAPGHHEQPVQIKHNLPIVAAPAIGPKPQLYEKRFRPPVAVTSVPVSFGRSDEDSTGQVLTAIEPIAANVIMSGSTSDADTIHLYLSLAQVRSLTIGGTVQEVKVDDKSVCQAFAAGPNQLKLIGTGNGVTRLVVWATPESTTEGSKETLPKMRAFDIHVGEAVNAVGAESPDRTVLLNQSIQEAFPDADVVVHNRQSELIVAGRCSSEATAKKIIRMVRKTCTVPVKDELVVR